VDAWLPTTCPSPLARLRHDPSNEASWDEFADHYGRHVYRWCRQWGLQDADAEDVAQEILLKLARKLRDFAYDSKSSFRGFKARWLELQRIVASKMLRDWARAGEKKLARFRAEADVIARLQHPNIFQIYDVGDVAGPCARRRSARRSPQDPYP
jgi:RNA polymerase sigma factor (sigma-70 family)